MIYECDDWVFISLYYNIIEYDGHEYVRTNQTHAACFGGCPAGRRPDQPDIFGGGHMVND